MTKIHVYFMPGMAASSTIFERIHLPDAIFEMHLLEWEIPNPGESLTAYAQKIAQKELTGEALRLWKRPNRDAFVDLVQNESPDVVEKILGPGKYKIGRAHV
jgi:hypothetical protein